MNILAFEKTFFETIKEHYPQLNQNNIGFTYDLERKEISTLKTKNISLANNIKGDLLMLGKSLFQNFKN